MAAHDIPKCNQISTPNIRNKKKHTPNTTTHRNFVVKLGAVAVATASPVTEGPSTTQPGIFSKCSFGVARCKVASPFSAHAHTQCFILRLFGFFIWLTHAHMIFRFIRTFVSAQICICIVNLFHHSSCVHRDSRGRMESRMNSSHSIFFY